MLSINQNKKNKLEKIIIISSILKSYKLFEVISSSKFLFFKKINASDKSKIYRRVI